MAYLLDYLRTRLDPFSTAPFGAPDAAALSQIAMLKAPDLIPSLYDQADFSGAPEKLEDATPAAGRRIPFTDLLRAEHFKTMFDKKPAWSDRELNLYGVAASPRYRTLSVGDYLSVFDRVHEVQFAAITFAGDDFGVVSYRGTDSTLTGWKEDCNMSFASPVPAQHQAALYLKAVAARLPERLYVIGHSKGGNLAEYATLTADAAVQKRIVRTYNLDGPGFKEGMFTEADYAPVIDRIDKIVPVDDIVGVLLSSPAPLHAVPSKAKGFAEHSVFTWEIDETTYADFRYAPSISSDAQFARQIINQWLAQIDDAKREALVEAIFRLLGNTSSLNKIFTSGFPAVGALLQQNSTTDPRDVATVLMAGKALADTAVGVAQQALKKPPQATDKGASKA